MKKIPSIKDFSLVGSFPAFIHDRLNLLLRVSAECGDIGVFHMGPFPATMLNSAELVHAALVEHGDSFSKYNPQYLALRPLAGNGLLSSDGAHWKKQRKTMAPTFQHRHIAKYADDIVRLTLQRQAGWRGGRAIDINREMIGLTLTVIGETLFGADLFRESNRLGQAFHVAAEYINYAGSHFFLPPLFVPTAYNRHARAALKLVKSRVRQLIKDRESSEAERGDLLSVLLSRDAQGQRIMTDREVMNEAMTMFLAGHETAANALTWTFYLLTQHPDAYAKLQAEAEAVLGGRPPTAADLPNLPYAAWVVKEGLRLYPPAYIMMRLPLQDFVIEGYKLHRFRPIVISPYAIQRRAEYFPEPARFIPERWSPEREKQIPRYAYIPFGAGAHTCIGNHFALMEEQLIITTLAQRLTLELVPGQDLQPLAGIAIYPKEGMWMRVMKNYKL